MYQKPITVQKKAWLHQRKGGEEVYKVEQKISQLEWSWLSNSCLPAAPEIDGVYKELTSSSKSSWLLRRPDYVRMKMRIINNKLKQLHILILQNFLHTPKPKTSAIWCSSVKHIF